ncbi:Vacuolar protein sorting-associated protein 9A [Morella rubra]|uniref:Vacuolar protein sorting-associated protein 9A n=1 Tax=Morella rubra TaxID=262757 RepID=A0A6A1UYJ2_9ROSI|nr:Vacuolar protein sorting-associated protein 9A [Morella rubra]
MENADVFLGLHDFLERMRQPSAADFVKSIKSFIVSFSNNAPDPEKDSAAIQQFLASMEAAFRAHPLWAGCSEEELESAGEGLEKYVMTKLFPRVFASHPNDVKLDDQLSEKMALVQQFVRPENLDIKPTFQNETSWLLAQKELQKINMYKAPRDKLVCILNCCKVISNLLLNASLASNVNPPGADEFLPVLIYVTIKANPPQLHSNLLYIQRYRHQSRLVAEPAYFFTNMLSAESFISNIDANALSMEGTEFEKNMESARALLSVLSNELDGDLDQSDRNATDVSRGGPLEPKRQSLSASSKDTDSTLRRNLSEAKSTSDQEVPNAKNQLMPSLSDLENKGAVMLLKEDIVSQVFRDYPYLFAHVGDLTLDNVEDLLNNYKQLVFKYVCLSKGLGAAPPPLSSSQTQKQKKVVTMKEPGDTIAVEPNNESKERSMQDDGSDEVSLLEEENLESKMQQDVAAQGGGNDEISQ